MKMKQLSASMFLSLLISLSLVTCSIAQEVGYERGFSYIQGSENGPEHWGELRKEWRKCKTGKRQSPINLSSFQVEVAPPWAQIFKFYNPGFTLLKNGGYQIKLEWQEESSHIWIDGVDYTLRNFHWHSPSEHTINGERFALELHMVHQSADKELAVIGQVYRIGHPDPFLSKLKEKIEAISGTSEEVDAGIIDPTEVMELDPPTYFYRYNGSLTTPPCTEGVIWTVNQKVRTVSMDQVALLQEAVDEDARENARPLQPLNGRMVHLYGDLIITGFMMDKYSSEHHLQNPPNIMYQGNARII